MALSNPWITGPPTHDNGENHFYNLPLALRGVETKIVYVGVVHPISKKRHMFTLLGGGKGQEGVTMGQVAAGFMMPPFNQILSEGPYQIGAEPERVDWKSRPVQFLAQINPDIVPKGHDTICDTPFRYRMIEERWWGSWSAEEDGYLGIWTRTHGWRWLRVRLAEAPNDAFELDPVAFGNNFMQWTMNIIATQPFWAKPTIQKEWQNDQDTSTLWNLIDDMLNEFIPGMDVGEGTIVIPNRGDIAVYPKFLVSAPGKVWIQEGDRWVELPLLTPQDGWVVVNTDPNKMPLEGQFDPVDPLFLKVLRNSQIIDLLLGDIINATLPVWQRMDDRFTEASKVPPRTQARIKVRHSNAKGRVIALMPQRYMKGYA